MDYQLFFQVAPFVGASVGLFGIYLSRKDKAISVKVEIETHCRVRGELVSEPYFTVVAKNYGEKPVRMCGAEFVLKDGKKVLLTSFLNGKGFPQVLEPGGNAQASLGYRDLAIGLYEHGYRGSVSLQGQYRDELGRKFLSKRMVWKFEEYLRKFAS